MASNSPVHVAVTQGIMFDPTTYATCSPPLIAGVETVSADVNSHYRAVIISGIADWNDESSVSRVLARARGGGIEKAFLVENKALYTGPTIHVVFLEAEGATAFVNWFHELRNGACLLSDDIAARLFGFTNVTLVETPSWPLATRIRSTTTRWVSETISRHILIDGIPNKYLKSVIQKIGDKFNVNPSVLFDEVYAESAESAESADAVEPLTYKLLEKSDLEFRALVSGPVSEQENLVTGNKLIRLHLVLCSIQDAVKVREFIEDTLIPTFFSGGSTKASFDIDPCAGSPFDLGIIYDSPLLEIPLEDRPCRVNNTMGYVSLLQLFEFRKGKFDRYQKSRLSLIGNHFGTQQSLPSGPGWIRGANRHRVPRPNEDERDELDKPIVLGANYKHRLELERKRMELFSAEVDEFTRLDREHRGLSPHPSGHQSNEPPRLSEINGQLVLHRKDGEIAPWDEIVWDSERKKILGVVYKPPKLMEPFNTKLFAFTNPPVEKASDKDQDQHAEKKIQEDTAAPGLVHPTESEHTKSVSVRSDSQSTIKDTCKQMDDGVWTPPTRIDSIEPAPGNCLTREASFTTASAVSNLIDLVTPPMSPFAKAVPMSSVEIDGPGQAVLQSSILIDLDSPPVQEHEKSDKIALDYGWSSYDGLSMSSLL